MRRPLLEVILPVASGRSADPSFVLPLAQHCEGLGFDGVVAVEHAVVHADYASAYPYADSGRMPLAPGLDIPDPLILLSLIGARTTTLGLGTSVLVLPAHHPVPLAKRVATLDVLTHGRLRLAVGVGWMREEVLACGGDFGRRGRQADEQLRLMRLLWEGGEAGVSFHGEFYDVEGLVCRPQPHQLPFPVHVGGHSTAAARRAGRLGAGWQPLGVSARELPGLVDVMHKAAMDVGRDPAALGLTLASTVATMTPEVSDRLAALGADRIVIHCPPTPILREQIAALEACAVRMGLTDTTHDEERSTP